MKKALLMLSILFLSVISTACINNFAVQELNSKAKAYLDEGDYNSAIERLKSSVDLDDSIFETHYNLAVAYTQAEDYLKAMESYKKAVEINPEIADTYYSLAVAEGNLGVDLKSGVVRIDENGLLYTPKKEDIEAEEKAYKPDKSVEDYIKTLNEDAVKNYKMYIEKAPNSADIPEVNEKIKELQGSEVSTEVN